MSRVLIAVALLAAAGVGWWQLRPAAEDLEGEEPVEQTLVRTQVPEQNPASEQQQAPSQSPERAAALAKNEQALAALQNGELEVAIGLFEEAVALDAEDSTMARNLSRARLRVGVRAYGEGRLVAAQEWFDRAEAAHADLGASRWWTARLMMLQARRDEASEVLDAALLDFPEESSLLRLRADLAWLAGDLDRAVELMTSAVAASPDDDSLKRRMDQLEEERRAFSSFLTDATTYFDCKYDPNDRELVQALPDLRADLDAIYLETVESLGIRPQQRLLVLFLNPEHFGESAPGWSAGLYDGRVRLMVRDPANQRRQLGATFRHELTHAMLHSMGPGVPTWLHEGLAQQREGRSVETARRVLGTGLTLAAADLAQDWTTWTDRTKVTQAYAYSLSFVSWLSERYGENAIRNLLIALPGRGFDDAWNLTFAAAWAEIEADHRRFLTGG